MNLVIEFSYLTFLQYLQYRPVTVLEDWNTELEGTA